jgi:capsular exopolysaccharide synthesis family protein
MSDDLRPLRPVGLSGGDAPSGRRQRSRNNSGGSEPSLTELLHLRDYWKTIRKRIWTLINFFVLLVGSVTVLTLLQPRIYEATSSLQIDAMPHRYTQFQEVNPLGTGQYLSDLEYYNTQHTILRSRSQARAVMEEMQLADDPMFNDADDPISKLLRMISVEPKSKTRIVYLRCQSTDRELTEQLCQAWAEVFVRRNLESLQAGVVEARERLSGQVGEAKIAAQSAEHNLHAFRKKHNVLTLSSDDRESLQTRQLEELTTAHAQAQADRVRRQAEYDSLGDLIRREQDPARLALTVQNDVLLELRQELLSDRRDRKELAVTKGERHESMIEVSTRIEELQDQIRAEALNELARARAMFDVALAREVELDLALSGQTSAALSLGDLETQYTDLVRESESTSTIYTYLLQRSQETSIIEQLQVNNIHMIDGAEALVDPVKPRVAVNITLAILIGLAGGISLAIFFDYMDTTIKTREEVEKLGIPFLGIIPSVPGIQGDNWEMARQRYLYSLHHPKSAFAEFLRTIRTNITYMARAEGRTGQRLLITSAGPREGKTTTSVNLGITMAASGKRVALVDADLRRPSLHHAFGLPNERGLTDLILGTARVEDCALATPQEGLFVIPSGPRPPNPAELLGSDRVQDILEALDESYDIVIIDTPPVVAVTDAVVLSQRVDGVILVVKSFKVSKDLVAQAKQQLLDVDANLIGVILNDFDIQRKSYGYYYYYSYYGSDRDEAESDKGQAAAS